MHGHVALAEAIHNDTYGELVLDKASRKAMQREKRSFFLSVCGSVFGSACVGVWLSVYVLLSVCVSLSVCVCVAQRVCVQV